MNTEGHRKKEAEEAAVEDVSRRGQNWIGKKECERHLLFTGNP